MRKGSKMREESRQKMIKSLSKVSSWKAKPIHQIKNGDIVTTWDSINQIRRLLKYEPRHVIAVLRGKRKSFKGYNWEYETN